MSREYLFFFTMWWTGHIPKVGWLVANSQKHTQINGKIEFFAGYYRSASTPNQFTR